MSYGRFLTKGAGEGTPAFWLVVIALVVIVGAAFLVSKARKREHRPRDAEAAGRSSARSVRYGRAGRCLEMRTTTGSTVRRVLRLT
ncbi:hypothetical protein [Streptomyces minutiscleroticus]|uniref:Uncharacterized protein n=1 Tax=Streptomyces minutiscleroticus TaxID=68238 RepID=A0A918P0M5_9ACTN|nr:hypothetical protein [Streptomyces minutiscleroticus]GGY10878.1 hypothetical protein GCM10010358_74210 [Streptomyces minutiscleroticus]